MSTLTKDSSLTKSSFIGLRNQGATCYLNSLIQTLFLTPEFRKQLFSLTADEVGLDDNNGNINNNDNNNHNNNSSNKPNKKKRKKIIVELMKLFARLQTPDFEGEYNCNYHALSTKSLTNSFGWNAAQAQDQHDINELYNLLLDGINQQMPKNKQFLEKYYQGSSVNVIICQECKYNSKQNEKFNQLNIILQDPFKKTSLLSNYLDNTEDLKDDNAYFCPQCNKKVHAVKRTLLTKLPPIIVCNLNRFYFDLEAGERKKINKKFKFSKTLNLGAFVEHGMFSSYYIPYIIYPCTHSILLC